ncbi:GNAT family N-acetyltransferase [Acholeplasma sp. OttesenSCG-928-E16]|nr:GNAT family N-acetyltransferase [Acholeplasma sp. OttesenSCG-928-E16]
MERTFLPTIELNDIILREVVTKDYLDMFEYGSDIEVVMFLSWGPFIKKKEAKKAIKKVFLTRPKRGLPVGYAIIDKANGKMIGTIDYHTKYSGNMVEIGYVLNRSYWNKGIVTKALKEVIRIGFEVLGYDALIIKHSRRNNASKRVIEKNDFNYYETREKEFFNRLFKDFEDVLVYKMTLHDYYEKKGEENAS